MKKLTIATRGSRLALWQAEHVRALLEREHTLSIELLVLKTKGDIILDVPLAKVGGKGLFVKEIEEALLDGRADLAVHSMKDVPMELPEGLILGVVPRRECAEDLLLSEHCDSLNALPAGARIGTSSLRRQAQILALRPDVTVLSLRGNVDTRLRKLKDGEFDAIIMAAAGMRRLGLTARHMIPLVPPAFLPAAGQGALGIEFHEDRHDLRDLLAFMDHEPTRVCVEAERGFLAGLEGGCQVPIAAHAVILSPEDDDRLPASGIEPADYTGPLLPGSRLRLEGLVADTQGIRSLRLFRTGPTVEARRLGLSLAEDVKAAGGGDILKEYYPA